MLHVPQSSKIAMRRERDNVGTVMMLPFFGLRIIPGTLIMISMAMPIECLSLGQGEGDRPEACDFDQDELIDETGVFGPSTVSG